MTIKHSFAPVVDEQTRVLVLGSLPGDRSLEQKQYYAHATDHFWTLIGEVTQVNLRALPYTERLMALNAAGIGLWDVIKEARRAGSLDANIRDPRNNDLLALVARLPNLRAIAFNGNKARDVATRQKLDFRDKIVIGLPSSSGANGGYFTLDEKRTHWLALRALPLIERRPGAPLLQAAVERCESRRVELAAEAG